MGVKINNKINLGYVVYITTSNQPLKTFVTSMEIYGDNKYRFNVEASNIRDYYDYDYGKTWTTSPKKAISITKDRIDEEARYQKRRSEREAINNEMAEKLKSDPKYTSLIGREVFVKIGAEGNWSKHKIASIGNVYGKNKVWFRVNSNSTNTYPLGREGTTWKFWEEIDEINLKLAKQEEIIKEHNRLRDELIKKKNELKKILEGKWEE